MCIAARRVTACAGGPCAAQGPRTLCPCPRAAGRACALRQRRPVDTLRMIGAPANVCPLYIRFSDVGSDIGFPQQLDAAGIARIASSAAFRSHAGANGGAIKSWWQFQELWAAYTAFRPLLLVRSLAGARGGAPPAHVPHLPRRCLCARPPPPPPRAGPKAMGCEPLSIGAHQRRRSGLTSGGACSQAAACLTEPKASPLMQFACSPYTPCTQH